MTRLTAAERELVCTALLTLETRYQQEADGLAYTQGPEATVTKALQADCKKFIAKRKKQKAAAHRLYLKLSETS